MNNNKDSIAILDKLTEKIDDAACVKLGIRLYPLVTRSGRVVYVTIPED